MLEPRMLIGRVIHHQVNQYIYTLSLCFFQKLPEIIQSAEAHINSREVSNIVSVIAVGTWIKRKQPNAIYTKLFQVWKFLNEALEVSYTIIIRIKKRLHIKRVNGDVPVEGS